MKRRKITAFILAAMMLCHLCASRLDMQIQVSAKTPEETANVHVSSDNGMSGDDKQSGTHDAFQETQKAFAALIADHDVYALLYQCDSYDIRKRPSCASAPAANILTGHQVRLTGVEFADGEIWYQAEAMVNGILYSGYIQEDYLISADEGLNEWMKNRENTAARRSANFSGTARAGNTNLNAFPASYRPYIRALLKAHPNWTFVPMNTNLDWNTVIRQEMVHTRNLVPLNSMESWKMSNQILSAPNWVQASESIVRYYMDPRNFLNETSVFQFEMLSFNSACHTQSGVNTILKNTFMENATLENGLSYAQNFMQIGKTLNVSPYHLASRVRQEQGKDGTSPLISGTYPGYEGLYNYYNIEAYGTTYAEIIANGLREARAAGWTSRYAALYGGSQKVSNNYIKIGQNTLYLQKFDVDNSDGNLYWHQYMQNLLAADNEGKSVRTGYENMGVLNNSFLFRVPVYNNMPVSACKMPVDSLAAPALSISVSNYNKIKLKWREVAGAQKYEIYRSTRPDKGYKKVRIISSGGIVSWTDTVGINKTYYYKIRSYRSFNGINIFSPYSSVKKASTKVIAPQINSLALSSYSKITIKWGKTKNITGYHIYRKTGKSGTYRLIKKIKGAGTVRYTDNTVLPNNTYYYKMRAYKTVRGKVYHSPYSNVILGKTSLMKPTVHSVSAVSPTKTKLSWKKATGVSGYQVYRANSYNGKYTKVKTLSKGSILSCTDTGLMPNKTYYYKIRTYRKINKITAYSRFSSITSITPRLAEPEIKSVTGISTDRVKISWKKTDGAQGYRLYRAVSRNGAYQAVGTTTASSYKDTGLTGGKTYYYKVRAYVKDSGSYKYSGYSEIWSVQTRK